MYDNNLDAAEILLVEDNPADVRLIRESFKAFSIKYNLHVVEDGVEALEFLNKSGKYENKPEPNLVFLDLNLPKKNGYEVLLEIKSDGQLKHIPVIILSTSVKEVFNAYDNCANSYLQKPVDFESFIKMIKSVESFWFQNAKLPIE